MVVLICTVFAILAWLCVLSGSLFIRSLLSVILVRTVLNNFSFRSFSFFKFLVRLVFIFLQRKNSRSYSRKTNGKNFRLRYENSSGWNVGRSNQNATKSSSRNWGTRDSYLPTLQQSDHTSRSSRCGSITSCVTAGGWKQYTTRGRECLPSHRSACVHDAARWGNRL